jgi:hypothetical protein
MIPTGWPARMRPGDDFLPPLQHAREFRAAKDITLVMLAAVNETFIGSRLSGTTDLHDRDRG